jgi:hypothetical protein
MEASPQAGGLTRRAVRALALGALAATMAMVAACFGDEPPIPPTIPDSGALEGGTGGFDDGLFDGGDGRDGGDGLDGGPLEAGPCVDFGDTAPCP